MKRILLLIDPEQPDISAIELAAYLSKLNASQVEYIFPRAGRSTVGKLAGFGPVVAEDAATNRSLSDRSGNPALAEKVSWKRLLLNHGLAATPAWEENQSLDSILTASRFADLIITSPRLSAGQDPGGYPSAFLKELLEQSECPVMVAPERFEGWDELLFAFDGSRSSMYAIRQFSYLFPQLSSKPAILLEVNPEKQVDTTLAEQGLHWMRQNYPRLRQVSLQGTAEQGILEYLLRKENVLLVMGAYGRNTFSRFFRRSRADLLMRTLVPAIFITHH